MINSNRLHDRILQLGLDQPVIRELRNGMTEVTWVTARRGTRVYRRSICARSVGGMIVALERAVR